jgi:NADH:ubiquinone oxidoreductase subunit K
MIPLSWFLILAAALFCVGLFGVLVRKNAIGILIALELMLNAANINLLAFWRYQHTAHMNGPVFVVIVIAVAAAEVAVGLAIIISAYRRKKTVLVDEIDSLKH